MLGDNRLRFRTLRVAGSPFQGSVSTARRVEPTLRSLNYVESPFIRDALEVVRAAIAELEAGACHQIPHGARDYDLIRIRGSAGGFKGRPVPTGHGGSGA